MKHHQYHCRSAAGVVTLSGLVLGLGLAGQVEIPEARAYDKIFAPQFCVPLDDDHSFDEDNTQFEDEQVQTFAAGGGTHTFLCPLIREFNRDIDTVWVRLGNVISPEPTSCCVIAYDALGEDSQAACETASDALVYQTIEIAAPGAEDDGFYVVTCELESGEVIRAIRASD